MAKRFLYFILFLFLLADFGYSFLQYYHTPLDGDLSGGVVPSGEVNPILESPFGLGVVLNNESYANPNRFFCHWIFKEYFNHIPLLLQKFVSPINSVYLASAMAKSVIHIGLVILLGMLISGTRNLLRMDFIVAAALTTPLFQTNGYRSYMGIIDPAITYTFFYALPIAFLLLYFFPFIWHYYHKDKLPPYWALSIFWIPLAVVVTLSGVLNPGIILIVTFLLLIAYFKKQLTLVEEASFLNKGKCVLQNIPGAYWVFLVPISFLSLYSLYIGSHNSIHQLNPFSLWEVYLKIPTGIYKTLYDKLGYSLLLIILAINSLIIYVSFNDQEGKKILRIFKWIGIFSLIYILLLPLGGYRSYRPYVLRYDTIMPITLSLMFVFGTSSLYLLKKLQAKHKKWYIPLLATVLIIFTIADEPEFDKNTCERMALEEISRSPKQIVHLESDCTVLSWGTILEPESSILNAEALKIWNITSDRKLYYSASPGVASQKEE
ncbi:MAG: hypothetical protein ACK4ND_08250 [Cytophagaceae bacterium]